MCPINDLCTGYNHACHELSGMCPAGDFTIALKDNSVSKHNAVSFPGWHSFMMPFDIQYSTVQGHIHTCMKNRGVGSDDLYNQFLFTQ